MSYLKQKLKEKHITQTELAKRCGISRQYVNDYCTNRYKKMNIEVAYNMAMILDIPIQEFIEGILQ